MWRKLRVTLFSLGTLLLGGCGLKPLEIQPIPAAGISSPAYLGGDRVANTVVREIDGTEVDAVAAQPPQLHTRIPLKAT